MNNKGKVIKSCLNYPEINFPMFTNGLLIKRSKKMYELYHIRGFTMNHTGGNLAGVVIGGDNLSEMEMQSIAKEVGYSETAFVTKSDVADYKLRFFTPTEEVDLCGHATIATFNLLRDLELIGEGELIQETKAGLLRLSIKHTQVYMEQKTPQYCETITAGEIERCFDGTYQDYINKQLPIQVVSTGMRDIMLPINSLHQLHQLQPNYEAIIQLSKKYQVAGIHSFTTETSHQASAQCRNYAPICGINEESATGTSNGALACYLSKYHDNFTTGDYIFEQGYCMHMPSEIKVMLHYQNDRIMEVWVGGRATSSP